MKFNTLVCAAAAFGLVSIVSAQPIDGDQSAGSERTIASFQEGKAQRASSTPRSSRALAIQEIARLTIESSLAFDRGDIEAGQSLARSAAQQLKGIVDGLSAPEDAGTRSMLSALRGRLLLDFAGDEGAAKTAFEDAIRDADNPVAERRLLELLDREARASGGSVTESPRN